MPNYHQDQQRHQIILIKPIVQNTSNLFAHHCRAFKRAMMCNKITNHHKNETGSDFVAEFYGFLSKKNYGLLWKKKVYFVTVLSAMRGFLLPFTIFTVIEWRYLLQFERIASSSIDVLLQFFFVFFGFYVPFFKSFF